MIPDFSVHHLEKNNASLAIVYLIAYHTFAKVIKQWLFNMKKYFLLTVFTLVATLWANAQNLDKMQWFNEPESYTIKNGTLEMDVPAQTDYWRISHYGFTVDDGPFLYTTVG